MRRADIRIREVEPADEPSLGALEFAAPDSGPLRVRLAPRVGYLQLVARYPGVRGYVALAPDAGQERVVGMLFSSLAPTQLTGTVVPGAYLFSLRVHPSARRRGIATLLVAHAWEQAQQAGAEVAWAAIVGGNQASLAAFARAGLARVRDAAVRFILPALRLPPRLPTWTVQRATPEDLPALARALDRAHAAHDLWRPTDVAELARQLGAAGHSLADVHLVLDGAGDILAAGAAFRLGRVADLRLLGHRALPAPLNRALAARQLAGGEGALVLRHRVLLPAEARAGRLLLRAVQASAGSRVAILAIPLDPRDPAWGIAAGVPGVSGRLHVVARSARPLDASRPLYLA